MSTHTCIYVYMHTHRHTNAAARFYLWKPVIFIVSSVLQERCWILWSYPERWPRERQEQIETCGWRWLPTAGICLMGSTATRVMTGAGLAIGVVLFCVCQFWFNWNSSRANYCYFAKLFSILDFLEIKSVFLILREFIAWGPLEVCFQFKSSFFFSQLYKNVIGSKPSVRKHTKKISPLLRVVRKIYVWNLRSCSY